MTFPIIEVPPDASTQLEQLGTKAKFWYWSDAGRSMLFKEGRPGTGENWSEKICCEIARVLGLPRAEYELALWRDRQGVVTPSMVETGSRLIHGNELLARVYEKYEPNVRFRASQHTLRRVMAVLKSRAIKAPLGWQLPPALANAASVFIGYLLLDALVGNQDRHHENWGLISSPEQRLTLAPTFDHASSLGRNETDEGRIARLNTNDKGRSVEHYVARARSGLYETHFSLKAMTTLEAFVEATKLDTHAGQYWLEQLSAIQPQVFQVILDQVPENWITVAAKDFAASMLVINQRRLLA